MADTLLNHMALNAQWCPRNESVTRLIFKMCNRRNLFLDPPTRGSFKRVLAALRTPFQTRLVFLTIAPPFATGASRSAVRSKWGNSRNRLISLTNQLLVTSGAFILRKRRTGISHSTELLGRKYAKENLVILVFKAPV